MSWMRGMALRAATATVLVACGAIGAAGCGSKNKPTMDAQVDSAAGIPAAQTGEARVERIGQAVERYDAARKSFHGHGDEQARRELAGAFESLQEVLVLLKGPEPEGAFRQQMNIIDRARERLTSSSAAAPEPTINAAIRAAQSALTDIASDQFADDEATGKALAAMQSRVAELDAERGPIHGFVVAQVLDEAGNVAERMAEVLRQRLPQEQPAPATAPAAAPAEPAPAPANPG